MQDRDVDEEIRGLVIHDLKSSGSLNDELYSSLYIETKSKRQSQTEMMWRLRQKGVDKSVVRTLLNNDEALEQEKHTAFAIAQKYWFRHRESPLREKSVKLGAYLQRRGFGVDVIRHVIGKLQGSLDDDLS